MSNRIDVNELIERRGVGRLQYELMALCGALLIFDGFDTQAIGYVAPAILREWSIGRPELGPIFSTGLAGLMMGALLFGPIADRFGRKPTIVLCAVIFGVFTIGCALTGTVEQLMVFRLLAGLGLGGAMPNAIALMSEFAPQQSRARLATILVCFFSLGAAIGGFLAAAVIPSFGWRAVFWIGGLVPLALLPIILLRLPESIRFLCLRSTNSARVRAIVARIAPPERFTDQTEFWSSGEEETSSSPKLLFTHGRAAVTSFVWLGFFMNLIVLYFLASYLPTILHGVGISESDAVQATALYQVGGLVGAVLIGWLMDRIEPGAVLAGALICAALVICMIASAGNALAIVNIGTFGAGFCVVGGQVGANAYVSSLYPTAVRSTGIGWALGVGRFGSVVGPMSVTALLALGWSITNVFYSVAVPAVLAGLFLWLAGSAHRAQTAVVDSGSALNGSRPRSAY
jgi:AAHS family 4-hydroxybenzoate transporter-like MFS transporter